MKNLSEFKKAMTIGTNVHSIHHMGHTGQRDEKGHPIYKDIDNGVRAVSISQTNSFALKTRKEKDGEEKWVDSWFYYPKAKECEYPGDNTVVVYEINRDGCRYKVLTYKIIKDTDI